MNITEADILRLVKSSHHILNQLGSLKRKEIEAEEEHQKKMAAQHRDDEIVQKLIGTTINNVTVEMYRHGEYADYEPTQIKLWTTNGDFVVADPYDETQSLKGKVNENG